MLLSTIKKIRILILRKTIWKRYSFGINFHCGVRVRLWAKSNIIIGDNLYIGRNSQIECDALIGNNVIIGNNVAFVGRYDHNYQEIGVSIRLSSSIRQSSYNWKGLNEKVVIEDDVWIGYGAIIMSGVTVKKGSIIAAGSIVTKDVDSYSIYGGNPAKKIKDRFENQDQLKEHLEIYKKIYC